MTNEEILERLKIIKDIAYGPEVYAENSLYDIRYEVDKLMEDLNPEPIGTVINLDKMDPLYVVYKGYKYQVSIPVLFQNIPLMFGEVR